MRYKRKIIIWGGNNKPLTLENIDSHASVSAYFLTKYLRQYYDIVNLVDMNSPEEILKYRDISAVISTFQKGFTNRLVLKNREELFYEIRRHIRGKLCSLSDYNDRGVYYEDFLFTVREPKTGNIQAIKRHSFNPDIAIHRMGWCAEPDTCYPEPVPKNEINIFLDHPPYNPKAPSCIKEYYGAFERIKREYPHIKLNVYRQDNRGITAWDFSENNNSTHVGYLRKNKIPWIELIRYYRRTHIFCITHPENACLSAIEAAMCGAKLYVPVHRLNSPFIHRDLLRSGIARSLFRRDVYSIASTVIRDIRKGFTRSRNHENLAGKNSWKLAAETIRKRVQPC